MGFPFRKGKQGIAIRLHELEAEIMDVVWSQGFDEFAVGDVHLVLESRRPIAYTTVMTTVTRLFEKELLRRRKDGRRYVYAPLVSRSEFLESTARDVLDGAVDSRSALAMLAERVSEASVDDLDRLEAQIRRRRQELGDD